MSTELLIDEVVDAIQENLELKDRIFDLEHQLNNEKMVTDLLKTKISRMAKQIAELKLEKTTAQSIFD